MPNDPGFHSRPPLDALRRSRQDTVAHLLRPDGTTQEIPSTQLRADNLCVVVAGQVIPGDGDVVEGMAVVDESAITGESAPVIRESGGDRSAVTGGTVVLSDRIVVQVTSDPGQTFLDRMIALVEGASRQKTPNEIALDILISGLTLILLVAVVTLQPMAIYDQAIQSTAVLVALFVCLAPTTIGGLLSAIGIAGMDRMVQRNVLAMSGRAVEAAVDCSTLLLDKTGTITYGNRMAAEFLPVAGVTERELGEAAYLSSMADETPEGRSIVDLVLGSESRYPLVPETAGAELVPFSAQTRMSGIDLGGTSLVISPGTSSILNHGLHGLTEVTYAYASVAQNNGSAFAGLAANTPWYDTTLGLTMLVGRFAPIVLALAIAGSLAGARVHARTRATLDTAGPTFIAFLLGVIVIVGGLIYFPMLILGPIGERIVG